MGHCLSRQTGSGTGVSTINIALYRMHGGSLYRVFSSVESHYEFGFGVRVTEQAVEIEAKDDGSRKPPMLAVRSETSKPGTNRNQSRRSTCETWRWNHRRFQFVIDPSARAQCKEPLILGGRL